MYIESVPNRHSPPAILLRESYREGGKVKKRTLLNFSDWPADRIAGFKMLLKGGTVIPSDQQAITIIRSLPHGHVAAALGTARKIGLDQLLGPNGNRCRDLVLALVVSRLLEPGSKLAAARALSPDTASSSLGQQLGLGPVDEDELYTALDWLAVRQPAIERVLAKDHLAGGTLVLAAMDPADFHRQLRTNIAEFQEERQPPLEPPSWERRPHVTPKPRRNSRCAMSISWLGSGRMARLVRGH